MRCPRPALLFAVLAVLCCAAGCGRRARVIPENKMKRIYADMFLADQWFRDHQQERNAGDTTLIFDPIFRRYGYSFEDFDKSVHYYLDRPDRYNKILSAASNQLRSRSEQIKKELQAWREHQSSLDVYRRLYRPKDFSADSVRWAGMQFDRPARTMPDTLQDKPSPLWTTY